MRFGMRHATSLYCILLYCILYADMLYAVEYRAQALVNRYKATRHHLCPLHAHSSHLAVMPLRPRCILMTSTTLTRAPSTTTSTRPTAISMTSRWICSGSTVTAVIVR